LLPPKNPLADNMAAQAPESRAHIAAGRRIL